MTYPPHIFADNPINRGETERRDEDWILQQAEDPASRFLPFRNLNVLLTDQTPPELGWLSPAILRSLPPEAVWIFLGLLDGVAHFSVDLSKSANTADRVEAETGWRFEDCRTAGETMSGPNTGLLSHARAQLDWNLRHGFCSVCGHPTEKKRGGQSRQCPGCNAQHFRAPTRWLSPSSRTLNGTGASSGNLVDACRECVLSRRWRASWTRAKPSRRPWPGR